MKKERISIEVLRYSQLSSDDVVKYFLGTLAENLPSLIAKFFRSSEYCYPTFNAWINNKVLPNLHNGSREILFVFTKEKPFSLAGVAILKNTAEEKKISSFRIYPDFQRMGIGTELMELCFDILDCNTPMITVPRDMSLSLSDINNCYSAFNKFMEKNYPDNFILKQRLLDYYRAGFTEYVYNGFLPPKGIIL